MLKTPPERRRQCGGTSTFCGFIISMCGAGAALPAGAALAGAGGAPLGPGAGALPLAAGAGALGAGGVHPLTAHVILPNRDARWKFPCPRMGDHDTPPLFSIA